MIRLESVGKRYGEVQAVRDLSLDIPAGQFAVLVGPSGCGKTTTLKMINRLIEPTSGSIFVNGQDTRLQNPEALRRGIGYVIQSIGLFPHMSVRENIAVVPSLLGWSRSRREQRADELLNLIGLEPKRYGASYPRELSGGQQQRVGVARALAVDPPVLLMDEPFGAVDPLTRERLQDEFLRLQSQLDKTIVMVTHDLDEAIKMADRIVVMNQGRLEQDASPETLLAAPKNAFVRRFVGSDRALKRLSRLHVKGALGEVARLERAELREGAEAALARHRTVYVTEGGGLVGYLERSAYRQEQDALLAMTPLDPAEDALRLDDDLREALSKMLGRGVAELPVVSETGQLLGVLSLRDIAMLTGAEDAPR